MRAIVDRSEVFRSKYSTPLKIIVLIVLCMLLYAMWRFGIQRDAVFREYAEIPTDEADFDAQYSYMTPSALDRETEAADERMIDLSAVNGDLVLTEPGVYRLTGELKGTVRINAPEEHVHLLLDNVNIQATYGPAVLCEDADKLVITLLSGTENTISDNGHYMPDAEAEACIYSFCDLTLNGEGRLNINGLYKDGIRSRDLLKLMNGEYNIRCKRTALHGNDGIYAENGVFNIASEKYGLKTTKKGADGRGNLIVAGGTWNILAGRYAFVTTMADLVVFNCQVHQSAVIDSYDLGGRAVIQWGCVQ